MRIIKFIVLHCTATPQTTTVKSILAFWKAPPPNGNGWKDPGYHFIILPSGVIQNIHPIEKPSNGVVGYNSNSIHISYIGGLKGDDRTEAQKRAQIKIIEELKVKFPSAYILGHTDFPGVTKTCPHFDVADWLACVGITNVKKPTF